MSPIIMMDEQEGRVLYEQRRAAARAAVERIVAAMRREKS
jgi:hypothetical protein